MKILRVIGGAELLTREPNKVRALYQLCQAWIKVDGNDILISPSKNNLENWAEQNKENVEKFTGMETKIEEVWMKYRLRLPRGVYIPIDEIVKILGTYSFSAKKIGEDLALYSTTGLGLKEFQLIAEEIERKLEREAVVEVKSKRRGGARWQKILT